jgi:hypothetical protein
MSSITEQGVQADTFLFEKVYSGLVEGSNIAVPREGLNIFKPNRPLITLTYAQSLDAKIAGKNGKQIQLSGRESATMTHR